MLFAQHHLPRSEASRGNRSNAKSNKSLVVQADTREGRGMTDEDLGKCKEETQASDAGGEETKKQKMSPELRVPLMSLKNSILIPNGSVQLGNVYRDLSRWCGTDNADVILVMTCLFYGIASPDAFDQLCEACLITRTK
jgi:hypothetical protein